MLFNNKDSIVGLILCSWPFLIILSFINKFSKTIRSKIVINQWCGGL